MCVPGWSSRGLPGQGNPRRVVKAELLLCIATALRAVTVAFVTDARLAHAHQLVANTTRPIADIAFASGFGSLTRFNAAFQARFARAPRELRGAVAVHATDRLR